MEFSGTVFEGPHFSRRSTWANISFQLRNFHLCFISPHVSPFHKYFRCFSRLFLQFYSSFFPALFLASRDAVENILWRLPQWGIVFRQTQAKQFYLWNQAILLPIVFNWFLHFNVAKNNLVCRPFVSLLLRRDWSGFASWGSQQQRNWTGAFDVRGNIFYLRETLHVSPCLHTAAQFSPTQHVNGVNFHPLEYCVWRAHWFWHLRQKVAHSCWDATLLRLPAGDGPCCSEREARLHSPTLPPTVSRAVSVVGRHTASSRSPSMLPLFALSQIPTRYTFGPTAKCYMISAHSTFC